MAAVVLICGKLFDGVSDALTGPAEILIEDNRISRIDRSVGRPPGARVYRGRTAIAEEQSAAIARVPVAGAARA